MNGWEAPVAPVRVELGAPDGGVWAWGPEDAGDRVAGTAEEFCLVATRRRHRDDTAPQVTDADAEQWTTIAQAYAGPPRAGREPKTERDSTGLSHR